jgi:hypothetical protein
MRGGLSRDLESNTVAYASDDRHLPVQVRNVGGGPVLLHLHLRTYIASGLFAGSASLLQHAISLIVGEGGDPYSDRGVDIETTLGALVSTETLELLLRQQRIQGTNLNLDHACLQMRVFGQNH